MEKTDRNVNNKHKTTMGNYSSIKFGYSGKYENIPRKSIWKK